MRLSLTKNSTCKSRFVSGTATSATMRVTPSSFTPFAGCTMRRRKASRPSLSVTSSCAMGLPSFA
jgi:hypothetical protein